ncbi:hypothetical protein [Corynebacterium sphenisci]|uniref:hypothetical protein n=1 Tax=Corynebacterium sphenisci TaxID=191493 RepID=UPI0026E021C9|nr:hypothetical protein [Corynebacterium sphenisci]MDO5730325.1 hypothetical protein [Corynebacterium sphenisci]
MTTPVTPVRSPVCRVEVYMIVVAVPGQSSPAFCSRCCAGRVFSTVPGAPSSAGMSA